MPRRNKPEFPLTASLEKFKYEVAEEISINNNKHRGQIAALKQDQGQDK